MPVETCKAEVKDGFARHNGDQTYQAEILMSCGSGVASRPGARERTMAVRGPCRNDKEQAQRDADALQEKAKEGLKAVRALANALKRSMVSTV